MGQKVGTFTDSTGKNCIGRNSNNKQKQQLQKNQCGKSVCDKKGLTDGYVQVEVAGKKQKTKTVKDSLNTRWEESFTFAPGSATDIVFKVIDDDTI